MHIPTPQLPQDTHTLYQGIGGGAAGSLSALLGQSSLRRLGDQAAHLKLQGKNKTALLLSLLSGALGLGGVAASGYAGYKGTGALLDKLHVPNQPLGPSAS